MLIRSAKGSTLHSLDDVTRRVGVKGQWSLGLQTIPTAAIVGSVDRSQGFDESFRPRSRMSKARLRSLRRTFPLGDFPPISVYKIDDVYFVLDGHHRVALANLMGTCYIDAEVIRLQTSRLTRLEPRSSRRCAQPERLRDRVATLVGVVFRAAELGAWT
jgi:hypothetical protein